MTIVIIVSLLVGVFALSANADRICSTHKPNLCISYSGKAEVGTRLQLKQPYDLLIRPNASIGKVEWNFSTIAYTSPYVQIADINTTTNESVTTNLAMDYTSGAWAGFSLECKRGLIMNNTHFLLNGTDLCLSIMSCNSGGRKFCRPSAIKALLSYEIRKGSYVAFRQCSEFAISQTFVINPPCDPDCSDEQFNSPVCVEGCLNAPYCAYNATKCDNTSVPTLMPTIHPAHPLVPSGQPTFLTPSTLLPTAIPSFSPSRLPSLSPYTMHPTGSPVLHPTETLQPTTSPLEIVSTTKPYPSPTSISPTPVSPVESPTQQPTYSNNDLALGLGIGLSLLVLLCIAIALIGWCVWKRRREEQNKPPPSPQMQNHPEDTVINTVQVPI